MSFVCSTSTECMKSELDLFSLPYTQVSVEKAHYLEYKPLSSITEEGTIEFHVTGSGNEFIDLAHTMLGVKAQIFTNVNVENPNAQQLAAIASVGPVNNFMHSLFSQVDVSFNQKNVSSNSSTYAYRAYFENLLNYGHPAKSSHLSSILWAADTPGQMDNTEDANLGLVKRRAMMGNNKTVDMLGHLHCDVFNQDKLLINGVDLHLRLVKSREGFSIMDVTGVYNVRILEATLYIRRVVINPDVLIAHNNILSKTTAKYPLTRVEIKTVSLHAGIYGESLDNVVLGQLPKRLLIAFVKNRAYVGNRTLNPFNFEHFNLNYLSLYVDGVQVPSKPLQPNFAENNFIQSYLTLFSGTGIHFLNQGNCISREDYKDGNMIHVFDLSPDLSSNDSTHWNLVKQGSIRIDLRFSQALAETVNAIVYMEFDTLLEIDASRNCITDFAG